MKEIVGIWSRGVRELIIGVGFSTIDPEGLLDNGVCLAPSKSGVNIRSLLGGISRTVGWKESGRRYRKSGKIKREGRQWRWILKEAWVGREEKRVEGEEE